MPLLAFNRSVILISLFRRARRAVFLSPPEHTNVTIILQLITPKNLLRSLALETL